ncbi:MAG: insulinase family protein [Bacteroidetes bacterium]|nr:insulinase family protein [Bacteroidota bacterium]
MKNLLYMGAALFIGTQAYAQKKIDFVEYDLPNGLHVILHEDHSTPIVAVSILYHVGSKNEKVGRTGFAHFFEHLLFEGSANIKRGEYSELVEKNGGTLNANTSNDRTYYFELLPSNQLELGLWLESERLLHAKVDNVGIETQRQVVKEEKRQRVDNQPYGRFLTETFKRMFTDYPYNWVPIGSMEDLDAAQEDDYVNFYKTFYVPSNATLSIAGDLNIAETKILIEKYFGSIPKGQAINLYRDWVNYDDSKFKGKYGIEKSKFDSKNFSGSKNADAKKLIAEYTAKPTLIDRPKNYEGRLGKQVVDTVYDNIQLPALFITYQMPNQTHPDFYALEMLNEVLSGGSSSRLNKAIVEKKQLAVNAFSFPFGMEAAGLGIFGAIASPEANLSDLRAEFDAQIQMIQENLITQEEFEKIQNKIENDVVSSNSSIAGISENLADNFVYYGSANRVNTLLSGYQKVTREDIQRVAKKYLTQDERLILYYLPNEK